MDKAALLREFMLEQMRAGTWRPGHRIPTERELGEQHDLSRSTVRRVLAHLKARGMITQTVGSGTYVADTVQQALAAREDEPRPASVSPAELMAARLVFEPAIVEMVVRHATADDFARMETCCREAEAATTFEQFEHWDGALHEAIAHAAHNAFVSNVFRLMNLARHEAAWGMLKRRSLTQERRLQYQVEHRELVRALMDRDAARGAQAARVHLLHVERNLLGHPGA